MLANVIEMDDDEMKNFVSFGSDIFGLRYVIQAKMVWKRNGPLRC